MKKLVLVLLGGLLLASCSENVQVNKAKEVDNNIKTQEVVAENQSYVDDIDKAIAEDSLNVNLYIQRATMNLASRVLVYYTTLSGSCQAFF